MPCGRAYVRVTTYMLPARLLLAAAIAAATLAGGPALAAAAPPPNDAYLASLPVDVSPFKATVDTTEATTQTDLANKDAAAKLLANVVAIGDARLKSRAPTVVHARDPVLEAQKVQGAKASDQFCALRCRRLSTSGAPLRSL